MAYAYPTIVEPEASPSKRQRRSRNGSGTPAQTRKSRGKSKTGCATCKRRHIRCDETHPKCRNCIIHKSECEYQQVNHMVLMVQDNDSCTSFSNPSSTCGSPDWDRRSTTPQPLPFWSQSVQENILENGSPRIISSSPTLSDSSLSSDSHMTTEARAQLDFYKTVVVPSIFTIPSKARAWNEAITCHAYSEPAVLHAIWALTSFTLATLKKPIDLSDYQHHKLTSLQLINQKLMNEQDATAMPTIYAIVIMIGTEIAANGDQDEIMIHLTGLRNIINLRGGWNGIPTTVTEIALFTDVCYAMKKGTLPVFEEPAMPVPSPRLFNDHMHACLDPSLLVLGSAFSDSQFTDCLDPEMQQILDDTRETLLMREACTENDRGLRLAEAEYFDMIRLKALHQLVSLPFYTQSESLIQKVCRLAMVVFIVQNQFGLSKETTTGKAAVAQLWDILACEDTTALWSSFPQVMSWAVSMGARVSTNPACHDWFIDELRFGFQRQGISCWQELEQSLQQCLYIRRHHGEWVQQICQEF